MSYQLGKETSEMPYNVIFIIFIALVLVVGGKLYLDQRVAVGGLEDELLVSRILFSEECLASENLGEINFDHFTETQIDSCSGIENSKTQGVKISFSYLNGTVMNEIELNKAITSTCVLRPDENRCDYYRYYLNGGILDILVANVNE